jgi:hypothetical protein
MLAGARRKHAWLFILRRNDRRRDMDIRFIVFYFSIFVIVGCMTEIYLRVRETSMLARKSHGKMWPDGPTVVQPLVLMVVVAIIALLTIPH